LKLAQVKRKKKFFFWSLHGWCLKVLLTTGGSAPKHVEQFQQEGHLRWDSLGEYLAVSCSLEHLANVSKNTSAKLLADSLNAAVGKVLENNKSPSRKAREIDNRGTTFFIAKYWAEELAKADPAKFKALAEALAKNEEKICKDLIDCQGKPVDYKGYYLPDEKLVNAAMRPSATLNSIIDSSVSSKL
jgi:isocitrate dehydrogenase